MITIGSVQGIQFLFDAENRFSGIQIDKHRKPIYSVKEAVTSLSFSSISQPYPIVGKLNIELEQDYVPDSSTYLKTTQELGIGRRHIEVCQYRRSENSSRIEEELFGVIIGAISFKFDLSDSAIWQFDLSDIENTLERESNRLRLQIQSNTTIEFNSSENIEFESETFGSRRNARIQIMLPTGTSTIQIKVNSLPIFDFNDTLVICRPDQLREAAIVVSCIPGNGFTPLVTLEQPPITEEEYKFLYQEFRKLLVKFMVNAGSELGRLEESNQEKVEDALTTIQEHWRYQEKLTSFRSWFKRNQMLSYILADIGLKKIVFLFQPEEQALQILDPFPSQNYDLYQKQNSDSSQKWERLRILPKNTHKIYFVRKPEADPDSPTGDDCYYFNNLSELTELAYSRLGTTGKSPERTFDVPEGNEALYLIGLFCALKNGIPLRPVDTTAPSLEDACQIANEEINSDEVVLIENRDNASDVIGVLYAHYRGASLLVSPPSDLTSVEKALGSLRKKQQEYHFLGNWKSEALSEIEIAVSAQIPDYVMSAVADRRLTVFTTGLPYSFVKKNGINWSDKAIGHIISDASLIILSEIYQQGAARSSTTFNLIFDPGFFRTSETEDVFRSLERHFTHSILLSQENASFESFNQLIDVLPLETIFFITHGADNAILLGNLPLTASQIVQWVTLRSKPIIFNNSCLSWTGVGQEFIRTGARGYIGTLWSVATKSAADLARIVMQRLVEDGVPVSEAICKKTIDTFNQLAYIFVGTANTRLDQWHNLNLKGDKEYLLAALGFLFNTIDSILGEGNIEKKELAKFLYQEATNLKQRLQTISSVNSVDILDILIEELSLLSPKTKGGDLRIIQLSEDVEYINSLIYTCLDKLEQLSIPENIRLERHALIRHLSGQIQWGIGELDQAIAELKQSIEYAKASGNLQSQQYLDLVEIFKQKGQWKQAKKIALQAKDMCEKDQDDLGSIVALGKLAQLSKRLFQYDEGLQYVQEGFDASVRIANRREQAVFKADEAQLYLLKNDYDKAIETALDAIKINRIISNELGELKVYGIIGRCYIEKGNLKLAENYVSRGLEKAKDLNEPTEEAAFYTDLGDVKSLSGQIKDAINCFRQANAILNTLGEFVLEVGVLSRIMELNIRTGAWSVLCETMAEMIVLSKNMDDVLLGNHIIPNIFNGLKEILKSANPEVAKDGLELIWQVSMLIVSAEENTSNYIKFIADVIRVLLMWLDGNDNEAIELARNLDQVSDNALNLENYVASPYIKDSQRFNLLDQLKNLWN